MMSLEFMGIVMPDPHYRLVPVGKQPGYCAAVDLEDWERVRWRKWSLEKTQGGNLYAVTSVYRGSVGLHRFIVGCKDSALVVDHRDGVGLNCRRYNLREATYEQNAMNRGGAHNSASGVMGISWIELRRLWKVTVDGEVVGYFRELRDAIVAQNERLVEKYGEYARLTDLSKV
jgi:hypothetical protein